MTESFTFQILADVSRFAAEAGKVPGITEKQAAAATARFLAQQQAAQARAAKASEDAAKREIAAAEKAAAAQIAAQERATREAEAAAAAQAAAAEKAAQAAAAAAEKAAREQIAAQERIAREAADAADKLSRLAEVGDDVAQANRRFREQAEEIQRLAAITGDQEAAARALAAAERQLADDLAKANGEAESASDKFGKVGGTAGKAAGFLGVLSPELADAARNVGDLADGGELASEAWASFGGALKSNVVVLGTLGAALAAGAVAYRAATLEINRINEQREFERELAESLLPAEQALRDAKIAEAEATGRLSKAAVAELQVRLATQEQAAAYVETSLDKINALEAEIAAGQKYINLQRGIAAALTIVADLTTNLGATIGRAAASGRSLSEVIADDARALNAAFDSVTGFESGAADARARINSLNSAMAQNTARLKDARNATIAAQKAIEENTAANTAAADAQQDAAEAAKARAEAEAGLAQFLTDLSGRRQEIADAELDTYARMRVERDREIQAIEDRLSEQLANEQLTQQERLAALEATRQTELVIEQQYLEQRATLIAEGDAQVEAQRAAARAEAAAAQRATQDALNTALAISYALATPLPPPGPQLAAAAAAVSGGVALAKIAATQPPVYHDGTLYADGPRAPGMAADEFGAILQRGEVVIPRDTASEPGMRELLGAILDGQISPRSMAAGMDGSSVPGLLRALLSAVGRRGAPVARAWAPTARPGRR